MEGREPIKPDQQQPVPICELQTLGQLANEDVDLLTEHEILGFEPGARFEPQAQRIRQLFSHSYIGRQSTRFWAVCHSDRIFGNNSGSYPDLKRPKYSCGGLSG